MNGKYVKAQAQFRIRSWSLFFLSAAIFQFALPAQQPETAPDFEKEIRPIFAKHCLQCHDAAKQKGGLRLDDKARALLGGDSGEKAIVPGAPEKSRLLHLVRGDNPDEIMPPKGERLSPRDIDLLARWIEHGAPWPESTAPSSPPQHTHWAFIPPKRPAVPAVENSGWPRNEIDRFILARLEQEGLQPSAEADRYTLIRRLSLDLTGLPPTPGQVEAFVHDESPEAYTTLVDRLLASPAYGERWARLWLDLARYADSKGYGSDPLRPYMWRYRDWVIRAFNQNMPYDQFTIEQLAGDLLPNPSTDQLLATAFHRNTMANDEGGTDNEEFRVEAIKDRIDSTAQIWMGLTLGCAKCHSHKFDPITQREYYQFFALFNQTADNDSPDDQPRIPTPTLIQQQQLAELDAAIQPLQAELDNPTLDLSAGQAAWEKRIASFDSEWTVLSPTKITALAETTIQAHPDDSVVASNRQSETYTYTIEADTPLAGITAFRLEVLDHDLLPRPHPERVSADERFTLADFKVTAEPHSFTPVQGRFIRIEIPGTEKILSLAEVQVFHGTNNLALSGKATQSSTSENAPAERAIDNNTNGNFTARSVTHTDRSDNPWWELDLGETATIDRIVIWNRTDNNLHRRLSNFEVRILDADRNPVRVERIDQPPRPSREIALSGPVPVPLAEASATDAHPDFPAAQAIDANPRTAWAVNLDAGYPQSAVFTTAQPVTTGGGAKLRFTLVQPKLHDAASRFRISVTTSPDPLKAVPREIQTILAVAPEERTEAQKKAVTAHYWRISPEYKALQTRLDPLQQKKRELEKTIVQTPIMRELPPEERRVTRMLIKGSYLNPGDEVSPAVLGAFHPLPPGAPTNRLGVALWLVDRNNPLTARVAVNRFWANLFGKGLVETEEDFGTQGTAPSHPELLDWLAVEFMDSGWDIKALLKLIVSSATYRQSSVVTPEVLEKDPRNVLLARAPRVRLEAEMVRDQALALAGLLSPKMNGPSVYPPQPDNLWQAAFNGERTWATSQGEDRYRRALYTFWRRTVPYPSMMTFDAPSRENCTVRRIATCTPLQAFVTLNDPVYVEAAQALARRIIREGGSTPRERAEWALTLCLARPPHSEQINTLVDLFESELAHYKHDLEAARKMAESQLGPLPKELDASEAAAWTVVANVLLNLDGVLTKG